MVQMQRGCNRIFAQRARDLIEAFCSACFEFGGAEILPYIDLARFVKACRVYALTPQHASCAYATLPPMFHSARLGGSAASMNAHRGARARSSLWQMRLAFRLWC